jgi:serine/threonine protein kinase
MGVNKKTQKKCAIKIIDKRRFWHVSKTKQQILREIDVLTQLKHDNLIRFEGAFASKNYLYIVLELATGGELFDKIVENSFVCTHILSG